LAGLTADKVDTRLRQVQALEGAWRAELSRAAALP
jgi:hypothetical protein